MITSDDDRPLIGISASEIRPAQTIRKLEEGEPVGREIALSLDYIEAVTKAGGSAVVLPLADEGLVDALLDRIDGLCLPGGPDVDPSLYDEPPHPSVNRTDSVLDRFERKLARKALERDLPLLAICRGMQILNVSHGGNLIQHLPEHPRSTLNHRQEEAGHLPGHQIRLDPKSRLAEIVGNDDFGVNTFHHQGMATLGTGIEPVGWDDDGLVEAIEIPNRSFAVGVQWHAELMAEREIEFALFSQFVKSAREYVRRCEVRS